MVVSQIQLVDGITRTLTCPVVHLCSATAQRAAPLSAGGRRGGPARVARDREVDQAVEQLGYGTPDTSHSRGYIEIGVKPGIVFSSFTTNRAVVA